MGEQRSTESALQVVAWLVDPAGSRHAAPAADHVTEVIRNRRGTSTRSDCHAITAGWVADQIGYSSRATISLVSAGAATAVGVVALRPPSESSTG